ncbi:SDR family oxidoreductase [Beijerinckia sp. L45]|uniref:SDR family oxidoreductase n=1 Tax=Beijerinckia sp. L45 TaxID=1641855 RepID=UPI00131E5B8B|nr:SDR family oxidoreductase [Beijerinckia sp. L45]
MDLHLDGKTALVTGGSAGIGRAVALALVAEGCRVVVVGRDEARLAAMRAEVGADKLVTVVADLATSAGADKVAKTTIAQVGVPDILVNSAGSSQGGLFWTIDDTVWDESLNLKLMGTIRMLRAIVPLMMERRSGNVVTIVGNSGRQPGARFLPGSAANAALLAVTKGLADEVAASGVVINAISPGPTRTDRWTGLMAKAASASSRTIADVEATHVAAIPNGRLSEPEEIARYVVFLCSPLATAATGTSLTIDGGATRSLA